VKTFFRDNGLTIALVTPFLFSALGVIWWGHSAYNEELQHHGSAAIGLLAYLTSGDFLSAFFENWESEFLQMSAYVMLTAMLFQRGSAESRDTDDPDRPDDELPVATRRRNPVLSWLYSYSLGIALAVLFIISFTLHWWASLAAANAEALRHGGEVQSLASYLMDANLWFESFQNWQSEFMSTAVLVVLSIFYGTKARRNRSLLARQIPRRARKCRFTRSPLIVRDQTVAETVSDVVIEEAAFCKGVSEGGMDFRRNTFVVIALAARNEPHRENLVLGIVFALADRRRRHGVDPRRAPSACSG
jgi:membrane protein implicated in regulation of membrane protease activity